MRRSSTQVPSDARIFVAGHRGLVGSAIVRQLEAAGCTQVLTASRDQLDLRDQAAVSYWFKAHRPEYVYLVAGTVGGIMANSTRPAEFIYDNLMIHAKVVESARQYGVTKLLYLGSSCIYPREAPQPIVEEAPAHRATGADQRGVRAGQDRRHQAVPVVPQPVRVQLHLGDADQPVRPRRQLRPDVQPRPAGTHPQFHEAKLAGREEVEIWGTGSAKREFLHVDDLAAACVFLMDRYEGEMHINVGTGRDLSIKALAELVGSVVHPDAVLRFDTSKPDGTPRKLLDVSRLHRLGWRHRIELAEGLQRTYEWFLQHHSEAVHAA